MNFLDIFKSDAAGTTRPNLQQTAIAELESRIDRIGECLGVDLKSIEARASDTPQLPMPIMELIGQGRKIEAIKEYRELTGVGLAEAKDCIDAVERGDTGKAGYGYSVLQAKLDAILQKVESGR